MARFENWRIIWRGSFFALSTVVYDDTWKFGFKDGTPIVTGPLSKINPRRTWVQTATSNQVKHLLGKPWKDELWYKDLLAWAVDVNVKKPPEFRVELADIIQGLI
jgi:hypothetical protein